MHGALLYALLKKSGYIILFLLLCFLSLGAALAEHALTRGQTYRGALADAAIAVCLCSLHIE